MHRALRWLFRGMAIVGVFVTLVSARAVIGARAELRNGEQAEDAGHPERAIVAYRRAVRWYVPGNPTQAEALSHMARLAQQAERQQNEEQALLAWRSMRGAILATRSVYIPHHAWLERADREIARITSTGSQAEQAVALPSRPDVGWSLLSLIGWLLWLFGAVAFLSRAVDEEGRVKPMPARLWGTLVVVGFGLFCVALSLA